MKTKYVEPKGYISKEMEQAFNETVKKQGAKKSTTVKKPAAKKPTPKKKSK